MRAGNDPVVAYGDVSTGPPWVVLEAELVVGGLAEHDRRAALFDERAFGAS